MPYFVYRVSPNLELRYIDTKDRSAGLREGQERWRSVCIAECASVGVVVRVGRQGCVVPRVQFDVGTLISALVSTVKRQALCGPSVDSF